MGYLNAAPDDDSAIASMGATGSDAVPAPGTFEGLGESLAQGAAGIGTSISHVAEDIGRHISDPYFNSLPIQENAPNPMRPTVTDSFAQYDTHTFDNSAIGKDRDELEKWIASDKPYQGEGAQMAGELTKGIGTFGVGMVAGGPVGAAALMGGTSADDTYRELRAQGVDDKTATEAATGQGVIGAAGALVPGGFEGVLGKALGTAGINIGLGVVGRGTQHVILAENGYDKMAALQRPFDGEQMAVDGILGATMGLVTHGFEHFVGAKPSQVDAARVVADQHRAANAAPGIPTTPEAANLHEAIFAQTANDILQGRTPNVPADAAQAVADNIVPDPAQAQTVAETIAAAHNDEHAGPILAGAPLVENAQAAVAAAPHEFAEPSGLHPGEPSTFFTPDQVAEQAHAETVNAMMVKDGLTVEQATKVAGLYQPPARDALTGFYNKDQHEAILRAAIAHAKETGETVHYVETDGRDLRGRNATLGHTGANETITADARALQEELGKVGHFVPIRHGGDEFSGVLVGAKDDATVRAALDRADARAQAHAQALGLKGDTGFRSAFSRVTGKERIRDLTSSTDRAIERAKVEEQNAKRTSGEAGPQGQEPGADQGVPGQARGSGQEGGSAPQQATAAPHPDETFLRQLEAAHGHEVIETAEGEKLTVAQLAQRMREEAANAGSDHTLMDAAVACFIRTGGVA